MERGIVRFGCINAVVGHTPLYRIDIKYKGRDMKVYAKAEQFNITGSIKDRMAYHILKSSFEKGLLKPGMRIAEATSGNTGISFAAIGSALGLKTTIFMPDWMSEERKQLIRSFGADIRLVSKEEGGFLGSIDMTRKLSEEDETVFLPRQFENELNVEAHYLTTGPEIEKQLAVLGLKPDAFIAGVGTGGTVMGTGKYLREKFPGVKVYPLEPSNSPTMSTGHRVGKHRIQGISDEFIPDIVKLDQLDEIIAVDDGDSIIMAQKLAKIGIGVGISSGANLLGAVKVLEKLGEDKVVVTVLSDDSKKYLSTDLMKEEPVKDGFLSTDIEIMDFKVINCQDIRNTCDGF